MPLLKKKQVLCAIVNRLAGSEPAGIVVVSGSGSKKASLMQHAVSTKENTSSASTLSPSYAVFPGEFCSNRTMVPSYSDMSLWASQGVPSRSGYGRPLPKDDDPGIE